MHSSKPRVAGRFIPSEEIDGATSWNFGDVDPAVALAALKAETQWREREEAREAQQVAYDQGFEAGLNTGREMARREIDKFMQTRGEQAARQMDAAANSLAREMTALRQQVAELQATADKTERNTKRASDDLDDFSRNGMPTINQPGTTLATV